MDNGVFYRHPKCMRIHRKQRWEFLKKWGISAFDCNGDKNFTQVAMLKNSNKIKAKVVNMTPRAMAVAA